MGHGMGERVGGFWDGCCICTSLVCSCLLATRKRLLTEQQLRGKFVI